ncbi:MAG: glycosyltransferase family 61 protein [Candidatus Dependentiae bacterium]|nr:glycosyltransferase family 61 protein [Candidatus Dependentiae bacterium]
MKKITLLLSVFSSVISLKAQDISFASLHDVMLSRKDISYIKHHDPLKFCYEKLSVSTSTNEAQPIEGILSETFVVTIPKGIVCSDFGMIKIDNHIVKDFFNQLVPFGAQVNDFLAKKTDLNKVTKISGRVAVITTSLHKVFSHWFNDVLPRLIILQESGIEYDWLFAPKYAPYMKETYELYGIPLEKIIECTGEDQCIQADELIVPSMAIRRDVCATDPVYDWYPATAYWPYWMTDNIRSKFLPEVKNIETNYNFSKKVFISRKDGFTRSIVNEDEIFVLFEEKGFKRYCLSKMSLLEQAVLFNGADVIVGAHGSALANIIFCKPNTMIIEIFQKLYDAHFCNLAQDMKCNYFGLKTEFTSRGHVADSTIVPVDIIKNFISLHVNEISY